MMRIALAAAAVLPVLVAAPASAATVIACGGSNCVTTDENVLLTNATNQTSVTGITNQTGTEVVFTSSGNTLNANNGQSSLSAFDGLLESITVMLAGGATFQTAEFNLFPLTGNNQNEAGSVVFEFASGASESFALSGNGNNWFGITAGTNEQLTGFTVLTGPEGRGVDSLRQLRFGGIGGAVPEPATWAMMLFGFGGIGFAMRRRKSANQNVRLRIAYR
jgi:hypothetical protein